MARGAIKGFVTFKSQARTQWSRRELAAVQRSLPWLKRAVQPTNHKRSEGFKQERACLILCSFS